MNGLQAIGSVRSLLETHGMNPGDCTTNQSSRDASPKCPNERRISRSDSAFVPSPDSPAPAVKRWLKRHSRFHLHFTPTSGSWLNMVERFFAEITRKRIRRGVFKSVDELKQAIMDYLDNHNGHPKPYIWTKTATEIFSKIARAKQVLESQH